MILMPYKNFQARVEKRPHQKMSVEPQEESKKDKREKQEKKQGEDFLFNFTVKCWSRQQCIRWDTVAFTGDIRDVGWKGIQCSVAWNQDRHYFCNKRGRYPTEEIPQGIGIFSEVLRRDDHFRYPRQMLAEATFPDVDGKLTSFTLSANQSKLTDSITVKTLPPQSVLEDIERELRKSEEELGLGTVRIPSIGSEICKDFTAWSTYVQGLIWKAMDKYIIWKHTVWTRSGTCALQEMESARYPVSILWKLQDYITGAVTFVWWELPVRRSAKLVGFKVL